MKRLLLLTAILALTLTAAGCSGAEKPLSTSEEIPLVDSETSLSQSETASASAESEQPEETAPPLTEPPQQPEETPEPSEAASEESEKSVVKEEFVLTTVSPDNVFVDYTYISDADYSTDEAQFSEEIAEAVSVIVNTEDFAAVTERYAADKNAAFNYSADEEITALSYFDLNGELMPKFVRAFSGGFESREKQGVFLQFALPIEWNNELACENIFVYIGDSGAYIVNEEYPYFFAVPSVDILDYGSQKHLIINGYGICGVDTFSLLATVSEGKPDFTYCIRGGFSKWNCFVLTFGWQGSGDLLYYDFPAKEYRAVVGEEIEFSELQKLDADGVLSAHRQSDGTYFYHNCRYIGKKYYGVCTGIYGEIVLYIYDGEKLVPDDSDLNVLYLSAFRTNFVSDIDFDAAISNMVSPQEMK